MNETPESQSKLLKLIEKMNNVSKYYTVIFKIPTTLFAKSKHAIKKFRKSVLQ